MKFWMYLFLNSLSPIFKGSGTVNLQSNCISIHMKANWMCYVGTGQWHWCHYVYSCSDVRAVTSHKSRTTDHFVYFEHAEQTSNVLAHPDSILIEIPMECQIIIPMWRGGGGGGPWLKPCVWYLLTPDHCDNFLTQPATACCIYTYFDW